jgi:ribosomal protein L37AE/L43A
MCGALGCTNDADGRIERNGILVWTCQACAQEYGEELIEQ